MENKLENKMGHEMTQPLRVKGLGLMVVSGWCLQLVSPLGLHTGLYWYITERGVSREAVID